MISSKVLSKMARDEAKVYGMSDQYSKLIRLWNEAMEREYQASRTR
jgi:myo-inositol catabolism protein IolC